MKTQTCKKISFSVISAFLILVFAVVFIFGTIPPRKSKAIFGIADVTFTQQTVDIPKIIGDILIKIAKTAFAVSKKAAINWITKRITNSILGIDETNPGFIEYWSNELFRAGDYLVGDIVNDLFNTNLCKLPDHFNPNLKLNLQISLGLPAPGVPTQGHLTSKHPMCQLSTIIKKVTGIWDSALASAQSLGHDSWKSWNVLFEPTNNEFGVYFTTVVEGYGIQQKNMAEKAVKAISYQGFSGKKDPKTGKTLIPGSTGKDAVSKAIVTPIEGIISAKEIEDLGAAIFSAAITRLLNEGLSAAGVQVKLTPGQVQQGISSVGQQAGLQGAEAPGAGASGASVAPGAGAEASP